VAAADDCADFYRRCGWDDVPATDEAGHPALVLLKELTVVA
jgi:hypothetical protein